MDMSDIEHFGTMISGCESINQAVVDGMEMNSAGHYAFAVLKVHAMDAGAVAGNESILDGIKKGAKKVSVWIKELIRAIRDMIKGISSDDRDRIESLKKKIADIKYPDFVEELDKALPELETAIKPIYDNIKKVGESQQLANISVNGALNKVKKSVSALNAGGGATNFIDAWYGVRSDLVVISEAYNKLIDSEASKLKEDEEMSKELKGAVNEAKEIAAAIESTTGVFKKLQSLINKVYKEHSATVRAASNAQEDSEEEKARLEKGRKK